MTKKKMKNVLPNSFEFLIHQFNSLNRELIHELWINSSIQPVSESYAQRFYHWGHAGVREIFRQQTLGCPKAIEVQVEQRFAERRRKFLQEGVTKNIPRLSPNFLSKMPQCNAYVYLQNFF